MPPIAHYRSAEELNARIGARSWLAQTRADHARLLLERDGAGDREAAARLIDERTRLRRARRPSARSRRRRSRGAVAPATFRRDGSTWELGFAGRSARLADGRGLRDLAYLLARPGEAVSVMELANDLGAAPATARGARGARRAGAPRDP